MQTASSSLRLPTGAARPSARRLRVVASAKRDVSTPVQLNASLAPVAVLAAINPLQSFLESQAAYFATLDLPEPLIKWGHPGNMAVVLFALGAYGCGYLGWQIRSGTDPETVSKASDLHPKLGVAMLVFFALGALGGSMSQIMQGQPLWESTHFWTGLAGLSLLAFQAMLPLFFDEDASARGIHAYLGVLALFAIHLVLGLQLGLSG